MRRLLAATPILGRWQGRRVRAYIGLGANVGGAEATMARAVHAWPIFRAHEWGPCRGCTRRSPSASQISRSSATPSPDSTSRSTRRGGPGRHHGRRAGAARLAQGTRARVRPRRPRALGSARARPRPPDLRARARVRRSAACGSLQRLGDRPGEGHEAARRPASGRGGTAVRPRAAGRPGAATRATGLGRHGRDGSTPPAGGRGPGRRAPDRYLGPRRSAAGVRISPGSEPAARSRRHRRLVHVPPGRRGPHDAT